MKGKSCAVSVSGVLPNLDLNLTHDIYQKLLRMSLIFSSDDKIEVP